MTTIEVIGTGYVGGHIAAQAVARGHDVTGLARHQPRHPVEGVTYETGSIFDVETLRQAAGRQVVVVALPAHPADEPPLVEAMPRLADAVIAAAGRLGVVGGAGSSLVTPDGPRLVDTPDFPADWKPEALAHADVLQWLRASDDRLDWFVVSPAALFGSFAPGEDLGQYRIGGDLLVTKADGSSEISGADYARAFVDEIERPAHHRQRFTVGH
jgi:uncharacterized protein